MAIAQAIGTSHLIIDIDASLGWVEGNGGELRFSAKIGRRAVPTPSRRPFFISKIMVLKVVI